MYMISLIEKFKWVENSEANSFIITKDNLMNI